MKGKLAIHGGSPTVPDGSSGRWPEITQEDKDAVLRSWSATFSLASTVRKRRLWKKSGRSFTGSRQALSFNSGHGGAAFGAVCRRVGPGDEVITTAFSFSGTFHPILQQNAIPIFVDIDPRTYNIDASKIEAKITDRTKVLMPVHITGFRRIWTRYSRWPKSITSSSSRTPARRTERPTKVASPGPWATWAALA